MNKIKTIIFDWAGTTIDYGSLAPISAFMSAFRVFGIETTIEEIRAPMGMQKRAHIVKMLSEPRLTDLWKEKYGREAKETDIDGIYDCFESSLLKQLGSHAKVLPGVIETIDKLRETGLKIGSTTGYTRKMMDVVIPLAAGQGYEPDCLVCPDEVGGIGRPYPYMLWRNLEKLGCDDICEVIKVGDTKADILEGKKAGCISIGVVKGSNMLGLTEEETDKMSSVEESELFDKVIKSYIDAQADYVIEDITKLPSLIDRINKQKENSDV